MTAYFPVQIAVADFDSQYCDNLCPFIKVTHNSCRLFNEDLLLDVNTFQYFRCATCFHMEELHEAKETL